MVRIEKSIEVNVPLHTAYNEMTQFERFPRFMEGVQEIRQLDDTHLHWHSRSNSHEQEWDAEITEQVPDRCIAWRNTSGHANTGRVVFEPLAEDKTKVTLTMDCEPEIAAPQQPDNTEAVLAQRTEQDLARFKKMIERQGEESGAWRGEVHRAQVVEPNDLRAGEELRESKSIVQPATTQPRGSTAAPQRAARGNHSAAKKREQAPNDTQQAARESESRLPKLSEVWEEPLVVMRKMSQEMDNFFERFIGRPLGMPAWAQGGTRNWTPPVEVARRDNQLIISADLPGIKREDIQVEIKNDRLLIEGDRHAQTEPPEREYRRSERQYGHFYREIPLPEGVDPDAAAASMHDGVLEITLPFSPSSRHGRRIDIQAPR